MAIIGGIPYFQTHPYGSFDLEGTSESNRIADTAGLSKYSRGVYVILMGNIWTFLVAREASQTWWTGAETTYAYICIYIWVNYNDLTTTSLEIIVSKGNHPQMALILISELL